MVAGVALATLARRGWRTALLHSAPLAFLYVVWWVAFAGDPPFERTGSVASIVRFVAWCIALSFDELGKVPGVGILLGVVLVVGSVLAWYQRGGVSRRRLAAPASLLGAAVVFAFVVGLNRVARFEQFNVETVPSSRYLHVVAALSLPAIAVAADAIGRRWRSLTPVAVALLLVGIPGNVQVLTDPQRAGEIFERARFQRNYRMSMLAFARVPVGAQVPDSVHPEPGFAPALTMGWLRKGIASGRIPDPGPLDPATYARATFSIAFRQSNDVRTWRDCQLLTGPVEWTLEKGESFGLPDGFVRVALRVDGGWSGVIVFNSYNGTTVELLGGPLDFRFSPVPTESVTLCR
jgi:hypothetical protein